MRFALMGVLLAFAGQTAVPVDPAFPVHIRIVVAKGRAVPMLHGAYQGYGRGEIVGDAPRGFSYTYTCEGPLPVNQGADFYPARWKKQDLKLELLIHRTGSAHVERCEMQVALQASH